jgi:hypothetical protein
MFGNKTQQVGRVSFKKRSRFAQRQEVTFTSALLAYYDVCPGFFADRPNTFNFDDDLPRFEDFHRWIIPYSDHNFGALCDARRGAASDSDRLRRFSPNVSIRIAALPTDSKAARLKIICVSAKVG